MANNNKTSNSNKTTNKNNKRGEGSARQLPDGSWECVIQSKYLNPKTGNPKRIKRRGETESEARKNAKQVLTVWEKEIERGKDVKVNKSTTFGQYMEEFIDTAVKPNITASAYHAYIGMMKRYFYKFPIAKYQLHMLNTAEFEKYFDTILSQKSRSTCKMPISMCKRCCKWLINKGLLQENYAEQVVIKKEISDEYDKRKDEELKHRKEVFSPEDIEKFYYAYKNNMSEYAVVVLFLLETGMRGGEFVALRLDNIDLKRRRIDIVESKSKRFIDNDKNNETEFYVKVPKNGQSRFVMMSDLCYECVLYMIEQTKLKCKNNYDNLLYPSFHTGERRSVYTMEVSFIKLCNRLGIDRDVHETKAGRKVGLSLHSLRHTMDTIANTTKGANVVNTALMLGHKAITMENVYTHATEEGLSTVVTPSQIFLKDYCKINNETGIDKTGINNSNKINTVEITNTSDESKNTSEKVSDEELYEMYLKLKNKFEQHEQQTV